MPAADEHGRPLEDVLRERLRRSFVRESIRQRTYSRGRVATVGAREVLIRWMGLEAGILDRSAHGDVVGG